MIQSEQVRQLALFFFATCLDEKRAKESAAKAADELERLYRLFPKTSYTQDENQFFVAESCLKVWKSKKLFTQKSLSPHFSRQTWHFSQEFQMGPWRDFRRSTTETELLAVVFCHVLGFSHRVVSRALGVSDGTLSHRAGLGLHRLALYVGTVNV